MIDNQVGTTPEQAGCTGCQSCPDDSIKIPDTTRRQFLKAIVGVFALSWGAVTVIPILQYLTPPKSDDSGEQVASVSLGKVDSIPKGQGKNFQFGHKPGIIVRDDAGEFHAFSAICSHLGCTVQYGGGKPNIWCACHGGQYDAKTGTNIAGPPPKPLTPLYVSVVKDEIIVSKTPGATPAAAPKAAAPKAKA